MVVLWRIVTFDVTDTKLFSIPFGDQMALCRTRVYTMDAKFAWVMRSRILNG
jgi:hypothetical protein